MPISEIDLSRSPRAIFLRLAHAPADQIATALVSVLEQVVSITEADSALLIELRRDRSASRVVRRWARTSWPADGTLQLHDCPWVLHQVLAGGTVKVLCVPEDLPPDAAEDAAQLATRGVRSLLIVPVVTPRRLYALAVQTVARRACWNAEVAQVLQFIGEIVAAALDRRRTERELLRSRVDRERLGQRLESQAQVFKEEIQSVHEFDDIVGKSLALVSALDAIRDVAPTDSTVLLLGETGTGKELFARALHERSARRLRPFVCINCAALPATLIESELFGHERGAFTGAITARQGRFELAERGTIFLDEIGDLPLELQSKLLRVLQEREFERVGSSTRRRVDVRVVAATHLDLAAAVAQGRFRADLYYRLSVFPITLPPLRERREDIPQLVWFIVNQRQRRLHRQITAIPRETMNALQRYHWPGNVRELENVVERAMIRAVDGRLRVDEQLLPDRPSFAASDDGTLEMVERTHIEAMLRECRGRINGPGNAAERLGLHPNTLRFRMKKLGIVRRSAYQTDARGDRFIAT